MRTTWNCGLLTRFAMFFCIAGACVVAPFEVAAQFAEREIVPKVEEPAVPKLVPGEKPPSLLIVIPDEPKTIDPAMFYPEKVTKKVTIEFNDLPLLDIVKWMQEEQGLNVQLDRSALTDEGISAGTPITDRLDDSPIYMLLDRLRSLLLDWYFEDDVLVITTRTVAEEKRITLPYNIGDLLDDGFKSPAILSTIKTCITGPWDDLDGEGGRLVLLGDVLFVRQSFKLQHQISGLLTAIRKHGRRTFVFDPLQHEILREKLTQNVVVSFDETPMLDAIEELSRQLKIDIRFDLKTMSEEGISSYVPVTFKTAGHPLNSVLRGITMRILLTWKCEDGVLWITTRDAEENRYLTAVFDVRDLSRNQKESAGLMRAIQTQTGGKWEENDGEGGRLICPKPGVLVARQTARQLDEILSLLENYRLALRTSKVREVDDDGPQVVVTKYYRMQKDVAIDVEKILPELVVPETWKSTSRPDAPGTIRTVTSPSDLLSSIVALPGSNEPNKKTESFLIPKAVLVIRQTRENHMEIEKVLQKIERGDQQISSSQTMGMGGGMGGMSGGMGGMGGGAGFGGGYFSVPAK